MPSINFAAFSAAWLLLVVLSSCGQRRTKGEAHARQQVRRATGRTPPGSYAKPLLATKSVAIAVVEPVLCSNYGKDNIIKQRPYEAYLVDGFWCISGIYPSDINTFGGTFEIIVEAQNGRLWHLTHGK